MELDYLWDIVYSSIVRTDDRLCPIHTSLLSTSIIMACVLLQQCSQYIVLHLAVAQFVTRLCIDI